MYYTLYDSRDDALRAVATWISTRRPDWDISGAGPAPVTAGLVAPINRPSLTGKPIAGIMLRASGPFSRDGTNQGDHVSMAGFAWEERTHG